MESIRTLLARLMKSGREPGGDALLRPPAETLDVQRLVSSLGLRSDKRPLAEAEGWRPPRKVLVNAASGELVDWLRQVAGAAEVLPVLGPEDGVRKVVDADAAIGYISPEMLEAGPNLQWIQLHVAGIEGVLPPNLMQNRRILVTNLKGVAAPVIAEHAFAMLLSMTRCLERLRERQVRRRWAQFESPESEYSTLWGRNLLLLGYGGIGERCARIADALGMRVSVVRNSEGPPGSQAVVRFGLIRDLPEMLAEADVIINALPLTTQTRGLLQRTRFAQMKRGAVFVNVGRGATVVTDDLVQALREGHLGGACLDVVEPEPLPKAHPLWGMPNVLLTPHVAGLHGMGHAVAWTLIRENLRRYCAGERLLSVVDVERGY